MGLLKSLVGCHAILTDAKHDRALLTELGIDIAEIAGLTGAAAGHVLGIEVEDYFLSPIVRQPAHLTILIRQGKIRRFGSDFKHD